MSPNDPKQSVETRCSIAVFRGESVLLIRSLEDGGPVWKLPGGHIQANEGLTACARRELREETGLTAKELHCALVLDVHDPDTARFMVEIIVIPDEEVEGQPRECEEGREPLFVEMGELRNLQLRPKVDTLLQDLQDLHDLHSSDGGAPERSSQYADTHDFDLPRITAVAHDPKQRR
ncbi:NUDIX domain-containing protein [Streptomyces halstedii]|uniref:NUDIX domain-containing protein n=1 Tax=Streptomyces halstedii TaxID=1944 RepID=UPI0036A7C484